MKRITLISFLIILVLSLIACSDNKKDDEKAENQKQGTMWLIDQKVDEFNDKTNIDYIKSQPFSGTFSNTATTDSDLNVIIYYDPDFIWFDKPETIHDTEYDTIVSFMLLEYNSNKVTYSNNSNKILKYKIGDNTYEIELSGESPNGDLYYIEDAWHYTNDDAERERNPKRRFVRALEQQEEIKCIIEIDHSTYSFVIDTNGFAESLSTLKEKYNYKY